MELIEFDDDRWYDVRQLEEGLLNISEKYGSIGYPFVNVSPEILTDPETGKLEILITVDKARRNFVERIEFIDNARTMDKVIRREFEIVEGDAYNKLKLDRSIRNVRNLGFFSDVKVDTVQGSNPDQSITRVTVQEQATGDFSIGVGYSSLDKTAFSFGINERNFLGTGRRLKTSLSLSSAKTNFTVGVSEPYLLGRNLLGSFDVFKEEDKDDETTVKRTGMIFGVGFSAADDVYHRLSYELSQSKTSISSTTATSVTGEEGKTLVQASVDYTLGKDKRDSRFDPTEGYFIELNESLAGFGGDVKFLRSELLASYYKPVMFSSVILGISGKVGHITGLDGEKVTQSQRFFLGGRDVRGFTGSGIGPRDTGSGSAVGGNKMFAGRMEILSNIGLNRDTGLRWTIFNDFGALWDTDYPSGVTKPNTSNYRASIGFGVYWNTAIGPLSFSWATLIIKNPTIRQRYFSSILERDYKNDTRFSRINRF